MTMRERIARLEAENAELRARLTHASGRRGRYYRCDACAGKPQRCSACRARRAAAVRASRARATVVTYQLAYLTAQSVSLCDACVAAGDHDCGALGPVQCGQHTGACDGARHRDRSRARDVEVV
jgi:hypothetical protein